MNNEEQTKFKLEITFDDPTELRQYLQSNEVRAALWDIAQEVFRPARKHGYNDGHLNQLIEESGEFNHPKYGYLTRGTEIVSLLEKKFYEILEQHGVSLDDI